MEGGWLCCHTRNDIARIHRIAVFDETKPIHELNLGDLASSMRLEMGFDIGLGS
jgi:hypothetical protein